MNRRPITPEKQVLMGKSHGIIFLYIGHGRIRNFS